MDRRGFLRAVLGTVALPLLPSEALTKTLVNPAVVPYKGKMAMDAAAFYCPYIPLQMTDISSAIAEPVRFNTRYGLPS